MYRPTESLNELQQPDLTGIFETNSIYSFATQPWLVLSKQWFILSNDWFVNIICSLVLSLSSFISLKYQIQTLHFDYRPNSSEWRVMINNQGIKAINNHFNP